jgi:hypothetical protein
MYASLQSLTKDQLSFMLIDIPTEVSSDQFFKEISVSLDTCWIYFADI